MATAPIEDLPIEPVGSAVTIVGEPAAVGIYGDGWGANDWAGNTNTSCEFVVEVHHARIEGLNVTEDNIRDHLKPQITVSSLVTGQTYEMSVHPAANICSAAPVARARQCSSTDLRG